MKNNINIFQKNNPLILSALMHSKIRDFLIKEWKEELFKKIKSIKIDRSIIITTNKPLINNELKYYKKNIIIFYNEIITNKWQKNQEINIIFK